MKIAVPWPVKKEGQPRIKEALDLWENKEILVLCLVEECNDPFLEDYNTILLPRNSLDIGTQIAKCYISDMIKVIMDEYPDEDWYGFGNSDCVGVGSMIEDYEDYEVLIYHRTDIPDWKYRTKILENKPLPQEITDQIWKWRQDGLNDKKIARKLNRMEIAPPDGKSEWTYVLLKEMFVEQGAVFFWGQDMYLFRADVVDRVMESYLKPNDPILGTGGFDPRLSKWCVDNFKAARMLNKIFHKSHYSEWTTDEAEYKHNGGDIETMERVEYFEETFLLSLCENGQKGSIPKFIKYLIGKNNPELGKVVMASD